MPKYGWSVDAIREAVKELNYPEISAGMIEGEALELAEYFINKSNVELEEFAEENREKLENLSLKEKTHLLIQQRLSYLRPFLSTWPQAIALLTSPSNAPTGLKLMAETVDTITHLTGDTSVDVRKKRNKFCQIIFTEKKNSLTGISRDSL